MVGAAVARGQEILQCPHLTFVPSKLEAFIRRTPGVQVEKQLVGTLTGQGTAKFFAVAATSPALPGVTKRGMEIDLTDGSRKGRAYADEATLRWYEHNLGGIAERSSEIAREAREQESNPGGYWSVGDDDETPGPRPSACMMPDILYIGLYGNKATLKEGVWIAVFDRNKRPSPYYFPGSKLSKIFQFIAAIRRLAQGSPGSR